MSSRLTRAAVVFALVFIGVALSTFAQNRLVNMVPNNRSGETNQDAEPTITVDPNDHARMAGSAFTWDHLTGTPMVTATAPIYVSTNGGSTWTLAFIVPSKIGASFPTGDITLSFSSTLSGSAAHQTSWLYGGTLSSTSAPRPMTVLRAQDPFSAVLMTTLDTRTGNVDQPHTLSETSGAGQDRLYVGFNNGFGVFPCPPPVAPNGRSSSLDSSQDATVGTPALTLDAIDARNSACQDGFAQVPAPHHDGTIYAAFLHDWTGSLRLVVVRDDNWGAGLNPFTALTDPSDSAAGRFVTSVITAPSGFLGQNRLGGSNVSIAVDPNNSDRVYVAWGDSTGTSSETIHVRRSINRGVDWSKDLFTVTSAMNPEVAINDAGVVGVLYQSVVSGNWETHFSKSNNLDATSFSTPGILLARQSATTPTATFSPYIGDYASLVAAGDSFVGMFSASNYPDKTNFMTGVKFQREVDWTAHKLFTDATHKMEVAPSIDPYFFTIGTSVCDKSLIFCRLCQNSPYACYGVYDPWWWLKCPMCGIQIFVNPGDEFKDVTVFDSRGREVGKLERLTAPVVEKGTAYTYTIKLRPQERLGYLLRATTELKAKSTAKFRPTYLVKTLESPTP